MQKDFLKNAILKVKYNPDSLEIMPNERVEVIIILEPYQSLKIPRYLTDNIKIKKL